MTTDTTKQEAFEAHKAKYLQREFREWDGDTPLYSEAAHKYFFLDSDLYDYIKDTGTHPDDLLLVICRPQYPYTVDEDYWEDILPEDMGIDDVASPAVVEAIEALNLLLDKEKPWSWFGGPYRTTVPPKVAP